MGYKIKNLGTPYRTYAANIGPVNLTAGVPVAELFLGMYGQKTIQTSMSLETTLAIISEITVTRRGETVLAFDNAMDLMALERGFM